MTTQIILLAMMLALVGFYALVQRVSRGCDSRANPVPDLTSAEEWSAALDVALKQSPFTTPVERESFRKSRCRVARRAMAVPVLARMGMTWRTYRGAMDQAAFASLYG